MAFDSRIRNPLAPRRDSRVSVPQAEKKTLPGVPDSVSGLCRVTATVSSHTGYFTRGRSRTSVPESGPDSLSAKSGGASLSKRSDRQRPRRGTHAASGDEYYAGRTGIRAREVSTRVYARAARLGSSRGDAANILRGQRRRRQHRRQRAFRPPNRDARTATIRPPFATAARPLPHTHRHRAHAHRTDTPSAPLPTIHVSHIATAFPPTITSADRHHLVRHTRP